MSQPTTKHPHAKLRSSASESARRRRDSNFKFYLSLGLTLVVAVALLLLSSKVLLPDVELADSYLSLAEAVGGALMGAVGLALLVDPFVKSKLARESGRDLYWAIFSPESPSGFREALQKLSQPDRCFTNTIWTLTFTWCDADKQILKLEVQFMGHGINLSRFEYSPMGQTFLIACHDGAASQYLRWGFSVPITGAHRERSGRDIPVSHQNDGRIQIDQALLCRGDDGQPIVVPPGEVYVSEKVAITTRRAIDFFPLFNSAVSLKTEYVLIGPAVGDLNFGIIAGHKTRSLDASDEPIHVDEDEVSFPMSATVIQWRPRPATVEPAASPAS